MKAEFPIAGSGTSGPVFDATRVINRAQSEYLDVIRGLAAQLVLLHHALGYSLPASGLGRLGGGAIGVVAFFLLSGFLIADNIQSRLAAGKFSITEFSVSRFSRIYLPYIPAILLVALLDRVSSNSPVYEYGADFRFPTAIANALMLQDYPLFQILRRLGVAEQPWFFKTFGSGRQFWTVSIEWWIYMTVGLATFLMVRRRSPSLRLWLLLGFVAVVPIYNLVGGPGDCLTLVWLFGAAANVAYRRIAADLQRSGGSVPGWWSPAGGCALTVLAGARMFFTHGRIYDPIFEALLTGLLFLPMVALLDRRRPTPLHRVGLDRLSFHSYSLYLIHGSITIFLLAVYGDAMQGWRGLMATILACNLAAVPFALLFERPHRRVRLAILRLLASGGQIRHARAPTG